MGETPNVSVGELRVVRICATILIVLCHIVKYYWFIPGSDFLGQALNVGVPIFFSLSGYLYGMRSCKRRALVNPREFFLKRWKKVVLECQVWALAVFVVSKFAYPVNTLVTLLNLQGLNWVFINANLPGGGWYLGHTWFVSVISLCYLLVPILELYGDRLRPAHLLALLLTWVPLSYLGINIGYFITFIVAYYAGMKGLLEYAERHIALNASTFIVFISLCIRVVGKLLFDGSFFYEQVVVGLSQWALAVGVIFVLATMVRRGIIDVSSVDHSQTLSLIEHHSYAIYLVHYTLSQWLYASFGIVIATVAFIASTLVCAVALDAVCERVGFLLFQAYSGRRTSLRKETDA